LFNKNMEDENGRRNFIKRTYWYNIKK